LYDNEKQCAPDVMGINATHIFKITYEIIKEKQRKAKKTKVHKLKIKKIKKMLDTDYV